MRTRTTDVLVIGGGMTGAGVLRDLAMRGIRAILIERGDLASGTTRTIGEGNDPVWGADSRHLLIASGGALILLDAQTGARATVVSGVGKISEPTWSR